MIGYLDLSSMSQTIASQWHINIQDLIDGVPVCKPNLADKLDDVQKHNILCI